MPKITVQVDPSTCILAGMCVGIEPKLFQIDQQSHAELIDPAGRVQGGSYTFDCPEPELDKIKEAVDACPTQAITLQTHG